MHWAVMMPSGFPAGYFGIAAFAETNVTEDPNAIDVPTVILHDNDDQTARAATAQISPKLIPDSTLQDLSEGSARHDRDCSTAASFCAPVIPCALSTLSPGL
jgi:non-heme chloroperoxidase